MPAGELRPDGWHGAGSEAPAGCGSTLDGLANRNHQTCGCVADGQAAAHAAEHLGSYVTFKFRGDGAEVAKYSAVLDLAETREGFAEFGGTRS